MADGVALLLTGTFFLAGLCLIPYPGIQADEVLFGSALYAPREAPAWIGVFKKPLPIMMLGYLGALKAWLYAPILAVWPPSPWTVRVPMLLLAAVTIWLFYGLASRLLGRRGGLVACALLAADTTYLLTSCFDWGPVVLQRLLTVAGVSLLVRFHRTSSRLSLGMAFFCFGLALWDKALFGWTLAGLTAGGLCAAAGAIRRAITRKNVALALVCFLLGAYPLVRYNKRHPLQTFRATLGWSLEGWLGKLYVSSSALNGSSLLGYVTAEDPAEHPRAPRNGLERLSVSLDELAGRPRNGLLGYALAISVLLLPFLWRSPARRSMVFVLVFLFVSWGLMFLGRGVGASTHHVALLWPWPHLLIAAAFAGASQRLGRIGAPVLFLAVALICCKALLATNVHLSQLIRNGAAGCWTDAIYGLSDYLGAETGKQVVVLDWGIFEPLRLLHRGRLPLVWGVDPLRPESPSQDDARVFREIIDQPGRVFVSYTDSRQQFAGVNDHLRRMLESLDRRREVLKVIPDSNGRPVYEVFLVRRE